MGKQRDIVNSFISPSLRLVLLTAFCLLTTVALANERRYDGLTLDEWRERIKNLDPAGPRSREAVPGLIAIIRDVQAPWVSRRQAAQTLGRIGPRATDAVPVFIELLDEPATGEVSTRLWATQALSRFGPDAKPAAPRLIEILKDERDTLLHRQAALGALSTIGPAHPDAIPAIVKMLTYGPPPGSDVSVSQAAHFRELAAESLGQIGPPASVAVPALIRATRDEAEAVRRHAVTALGAMGAAAEIAIEPLAEAMVFDESAAVRDQAAAALAKIGPPAVPILRHLLTADDPEFRRRSAVSLGLMGPAANEAAPDLKPLLDDDQPEIRMAAAEALSSITTDPTAVLPAAIRELQSEDRQMRMRAVRLFERMGPKAQPAVDELRRLTRDPRSHVRQAAAKALESIESP